MMNKILNRLPRVEGILSVLADPNQVDRRVALASGRTLMLENRLEGRYPLEAIQMTQSLSAKSCVAHAIAAVTAIENYLQLDPTSAALRIRLIMTQLSSIYSHIHHFYIELLPDYLNDTHFGDPESRYLKYFIGFRPNERQRGDLPGEVGKRILANMPQAIESLKQIQQVLTLLGGKFPIVMNIIPGGVTNFNIDPPLVMDMTRKLEQSKPFIESTWPQDVKAFISASPDTGTVLEKNVNLISFGSQPSGYLTDQSSVYAEGVWINGRLEPVNELKITESFDNTFFIPLSKLAETPEKTVDPGKSNARTWIKGARYDKEPMLAGSLSRMLVTHFGGGNMEISDRVGQIVDDLGITIESPNCVASRILSEVFEGRLYLRTVITALLEYEFGQPLNRDAEFDFTSRGAGIGKVEAPSGALLHQIYIENEKIAKYRVVSATNWNFSTTDSDGKVGIVEQELNVLRQKGEITSAQASRLLHSYNAQVIDGTR